ncbi:MAG: SDR family NAD(P)-dependent oxidoreductase [Caldilineaceae bacterium]
MGKYAVASIAGLMAYPGFGIYKVAKHGVVTPSETLYYELAQRNTQVGVWVLCPSFVKTNVMTSERNRPAELQNAPSEESVSPPSEQQFLEFMKIVESGMAVEQVADAVFAGVAAKQLYILTHPEFNDAITTRAANIVLQRNPVVG